MKCLVVVAHPVASSACHAMARTAIEALAAAGHEVQIEDLYAAGFSPALTADERRSYYGATFDAAAVHSQAERLQSAAALVLVFPTWWFGFPAILKGWFDRVWAPGVAYSAIAARHELFCDCASDLVGWTAMRRRRMVGASIPYRNIAVPAPVAALLDRR